MAYKVLADDNFRYSDPEGRSTLGSFATQEEALLAARKIVDDFLSFTYRPGMSAKALFDSYKAFGEDPFIISSGQDRVEFSAWDYARLRCTEMCERNETSSKENRS